MTTFAHAVLEVARKEVTQHVRTKRLWILLPAFVLALTLITIVLPLAIMRGDGLREIGNQATVGLQNIVMLFFLSGFFFLSGYFYVQLIPIVLTADAVCSEWSNRTIFLLLSKPVSRAAFVMGKFLGSLVTVAAILVVCLTLDYLLLQALLPGHSSAADWGRFAGALGILVLGAAAYTALALMFSTFTRSAVQANLMSIVTWIIFLPLLAKMDYFVALMRHGIEGFASDQVGWSQYLSPGDSMRAATTVLVPQFGSANSGLVGSLLGFGADINAWGAVAALAIHTALFLGISLVVVGRRDFE